MCNQSHIRPCCRNCKSEDRAAGAIAGAAAAASGTRVARAHAGARARGETRQGASARRMTCQKPFPTYT
eukprot:2898112-Pyramimonas_sp.AAC.1